MTNETITDQAFLIKNLVKEALAEVGLITPFITRQEIIQQIGRHRYEKAVKSGLISRQKAEGQNSTVRVKRAEFTEFLMKGLI